METVHDSVAWYQQKVGSYDKQLWEQSVEQKVLRGIKHLPRRSVRPKTELIDVDLVRGSTFTKAKPQVPWTYITLKTIGRVVLFPFYYKWWIQQTSFKFWVFLLLLYVLQVFTTVVFFNNVGDIISQDELTLSEVAIPAVLMILLGLVHSQTVLTHLSLKAPGRDSKRDARRKRSLSQNFYGCNQDLPGSGVSSDYGNSPVKNQSGWKDKDHGQGPLSQRDYPGNKLRGRAVASKDLKQRSRSGLTQNPSRDNSRHPSPAPQCQQRDSESAYISHEGSDSIGDRSSHEHESQNGHRVENRSSSQSYSSQSKQEQEYQAFRKARESQDSDVQESPDEKDGSGSDDKDSLSDEDMKDKYEILSLDKRAAISSAVLGLSVPSSTDSTLISVENGSEESVDVKPTNVKTRDDTLTRKMLEVHSQTEKKDMRNSDECDWKSDKKDTDQIHNLPNTESGISIKVSSECHSPELEKKSSQSGHIGASGCENPEIMSNRENVTVADTSTKKISSPQIVSNDTSSVYLSANDVSPKVSNNEIKEQNLSPSEESSTLIFDTVSDGVVIVNPKEPSTMNVREVTPTRSREATPPAFTKSDTALLSRSMLRKSSLLKQKQDSESETENENKRYPSKPGIRRRKVTLLDGTDSGSGSLLRQRRAQSGLSLRNKEKASTAASSTDGETTERKVFDSPNSQGTMSSEEWEDRIQTDDTSSSYSSSCGSEPEVSGNEEQPLASESEAATQQSSSNQGTGMTASNIHVVNLLQANRAPARGRFESGTQSTIHGPPDKVTCIIWEGNECKKVELTVMDIGWAIIDTVDKIPESSDYIYIGLAFSLLISLTPILFQGYHAKELQDLTTKEGWLTLWALILNNPWRVNLTLANAIIQRLCLSSVYFFLLSVADRTFKQRLLYAKHFCYLTSSRRAKKFDMPHFRLNKVRNIKTWLSLRSYLKKRGPQRSVDVIVSATFLTIIVLLIFMCLQLLRDAEIYLDYLCNWELLMWCMALGVYLLRFMTLGLKINKKYRNLSVLITEQINLYLQMEQKPHKKEELMVANNVLKLAESLLKELESPFKISGISANPFILNVTKVVVLSAFSAVLTELLGFKLKLYKIKLKA